MAGRVPVPGRPDLAGDRASALRAQPLFHLVRD
jgi:hypothetical protein